MARRIEVEIIGDSRSLERAFDRSARSAKTFQAQVSGIGSTTRRAFTGTAAALGVGLGIDTLVKGIGGAVDASSDLAESISKTNVVFGESAREVRAWSKTTTAVLGVSRQQALETASSFGALFAPLGLVGETAAEQSKRLTELGADLASFYNTDVQSALDAIRSGLIGEMEPLRRYGVVLLESRVQQEALTETGKASVKQLTQQEKVQARINLIFRDTVKAQGDAARSSERFAGQMKILQARLADTAAAIGGVLAPEILNVVANMNDWLAKTENQQRLLETTREAVKDFAAVAQTAAAVVQGLADAFDALRDAYNGLPDFGKNRGLFQILHVPRPDHGIFAWLRDRGKEDAAPAAPPGLAGPTRTSGAMTPPGLKGPLAAPSAEELAAAAAAEAKALRDARKRAQRLVELRNQWFDATVGRQLGRVQDIRPLSGQIARLREIAALIQQRIAATKDVTRKLTLEDQLLEVQRSIRADQEQLSEKAKQDRADATDTMFGWLQLHVDEADLTKTTSDNQRALKAQQKAIREQIRQEGYTLELAHKLLDNRLALKALSDQQDDEETPFRHYNSAKLAEMLGLGGNRYAQTVLAMIGRGGGFPSGSRAFAGAGGGVVINGAVTVNGVQDVRAFGNAMQKQGRGQPHTRRGAR